jgi:hypothetical protein
MSSRYDVMSPRKDREGKTRWTRIGVMFPAKSGNGFAIKLDALPLPDEKGEVWISAMEPREREEGQEPGERPRPAPTMRMAAPRGPTPTESQLNDEIPF